MLRFLWCEAAIHAGRRDAVLGRFFRCKLQQKGLGKARVAVARKLYWAVVSNTPWLLRCRSSRFGLERERPSQRIEDSARWLFDGQGDRRHTEPTETDMPVGIRTTRLLCRWNRHHGGCADGEVERPIL
jgi:hypothetical protein